MLLNNIFLTLIFIWCNCFHANNQESFSAKDKILKNQRHYAHKNVFKVYDYIGTIKEVHFSETRGNLHETTKIQDGHSLSSNGLHVQTQCKARKKS